MKDREIPARRLPFWVDFSDDGSGGTLVEPHEGFTLKAGEVRIGDWRLRASGTSLYVELWNGSSWTVKHTFS